MFVTLKDNQIKPVSFRPYAGASIVTYLPILTATDEHGTLIHFIEGPEKTVTAWFEIDGRFEQLYVWDKEAISLLITANNRIETKAAQQASSGVSPIVGTIQGATSSGYDPAESKDAMPKPEDTKQENTKQTEPTKAEVEEAVRVRVGDVVRLGKGPDMKVLRVFTSGDTRMCLCGIWVEQREKIETYELPVIALVNRSGMYRFEKLQEKYK